MESLGTQISQFVERCRAQQAVRASDARKSAILNAAFDCIVTMDHDGRVLEVNRAAERTFGYAAAEMVGRDLADLIIPPHLRDAHRRGLARYLRTGISMVGGHPLELEGMRKDGSEFPIEVVVTRADLPGPPLFAGYLRDVTEAREREEDLRRLADEQAALRRVATAVAADDRPAARVRASSPRRSGGCSARRARTWCASTTTASTATVVGGWSEGDGRAPCRSARRCGSTATRSPARVYRTRRARRGSTTTTLERRARRRTCSGSASSARSPRRSSSTAACGAT